MPNFAQTPSPSDLEAEPIRTRWRRLIVALGARPLRPSATRVWLFTAFLGGMATYIFVDWVMPLRPVISPVWIPWPLLAAAFVLAETKVIDVHYRRETHSFSLSEIPAVIGLFFVPPNEYMVAVLVGSGVALLVTARQRW